MKFILFKLLLPDCFQILNLITGSLPGKPIACITGYHFNKGLIFFIEADGGLNSE